MERGESIEQVPLSKKFGEGDLEGEVNKMQAKTGICVTSISEINDPNKKGMHTHPSK
jgi:hypothetical protein